MNDEYIISTENKLAEKYTFNICRLLQYVIKSLIFAFMIFSIYFADKPNIICMAALLLMLISPVLYFSVMLLLLILAAEFPRRFRIEKNFFTKHILNILIISFGTALFTNAFVMIKNASEKAAQNELNDKISYYVNNSEIIAAVNPEEHYSRNGIAGTGIMYPSLFVDYDTHSAAFLLNDYEFKEYHLKENGETPPGKIQCEIPINSPGNMLVSYYPGEESEAHRTTGLVLIMEDGTRYSCLVTSKNFDDDFLGLDARIDGSWYAEHTNDKLIID